MLWHVAGGVYRTRGAHQPGVRLCFKALKRKFLQDLQCYAPLPVIPMQRVGNLDVLWTAAMSESRTVALSVLSGCKGLG